MPNFPVQGLGRAFGVPEGAVLPRMTGELLHRRNILGLLAFLCP